MDIILRFAALRRTASSTASLSLATDSNFQRELADHLAEGQPLAQLDGTIRRFTETDFVRSPDQLPHGERLLMLLEGLRGGKLPAARELTTAFRKAAGSEDAASLTGDLARARDSVLASYLLADGPDAAVAQNLVRAYSMAAAVLSGTTDRALLESMLDGGMALPDFLLGARRPSTDVPPVPPPEDVARGLVEQINALAEYHRNLSATVDELAFHAEDELDLDEGGDRRPLAELYMPSARHGRDHAAVGDRPTKVSADEPTGPGASPMLRAAAGRNVVLSARALDLLPDHVVATVRSLHFDAATSTVAEMRSGGERALHDVGQQLMILSGRLSEFAVEKSGSALVDPRWSLDPVNAPDPVPPIAASAPTTKTEVRPLGVADLLLVRAHISHYERAEVAAIENVLAHERLTHTVRRLDTSETTTTEEKEATDLRSQTQTTAEQENGRTMVQAVGPGVGPLAAEGANTFAKTVTDQVSSTSTSRTRRLAVQRQLREMEDTAEHLIDNADGPVGRYGVYQWLDKFYAAQAYSYGSRLLYDIIVPEPAALFREALSRPRSGLKLPVKPALFTLSPGYLTAVNWAYYAAGHHASGVEAPPPAEIIVSEPFGQHAKDQFATDAPTNTLTVAEARTTRIPKGYRATKFRVVILSSSFPEGIARVSVGTKIIEISPAQGPFLKSGKLEGERESIPVALEVTSNGRDWGISDLTVGVEIVCEATDQLMSAWQVKAHAQILDANRRRFQEYEEAVANRDATARLFLQGLPAARKTAIVHTEVKRAALEFLTGQSFGGFNATGVDVAGFPFPVPAATTALSAYIRFFEHAVEWDHLAYAFYPYFWGSQPSWVAKLLTNEGEERLAGFLTAGAARVVLPIRLGYERAFERFLHTGWTPTTDELLDVGSPLWVSLVDELRHQASDEGQETPVGEPWHFRIATDLVRARTDGSMPKWTLKQGTWQDAADPAF